MVSRYDIQTGFENVAKHFAAGSGGTVLDADDIRDAEDLDELQQTYQQNGVNVSSPEEAYAQARQDWWEQVREDDFDPVNELPGDSVTLTVTHDGEQYETTFHVHGVSHGQQVPGDGGGVKELIEDRLEMSDEVREFLQDEVERFHSAGEPTYVEEGFGEIIYPEGGSVPLHDTADQKALAEEMGEDFDARFKVKMLAGTLYSKSAALQNAPLDETTQTKQMMAVQNASTGALNDVEAIPDLQNTLEAFQLPYHLEEDYGELVAEEMQDKADQLSQSGSSGLLGGIVDKAKQWAAESAADIGTDLEYRRSELMVEDALPELYNEDVEDVHLVVGAGHHPSAVQYLEDLEAGELRSYAPGA